MVIELFGGICSGLEMMLRAGVPVTHYIYVDGNSDVRSAARMRMVHLNRQFHNLWGFNDNDSESMFNALSQQVEDISEAEVQALCRNHPHDILLVAGFPCQDLSPAGKGHGFNGRHSKDKVALRLVAKNESKKLHPRRTR